MYVSVAYECGECYNKGFAGGIIDVDMRPPDYRKWKIIIHAECTACHHHNEIKLSEIVERAQEEAIRQEFAPDLPESIEEAKVRLADGGC